LPKAFQQHQECFRIPIRFSLLILYSFHWENDSIIIIDSFHIIAPNSLKPNRCTPHSSRAFQRYQGCSMKHHGLGDLSLPKQNKLSCFIDWELGITRKNEKIKYNQWKSLKNHHFLGCLTPLAMATAGMGPASALPYMDPFTLLW
jgi:hypothetical protein